MVDTTLRNATSTDAYAIDTVWRSVGGQTRRKAMVFRFCTMAEMELVSCTGQASQPQPLEAVVSFPYLVYHWGLFEASGNVA